MGKVVARRHSSESPFDDEWRRNTLAALAAHPYSGAIIMKLHNTAHQYSGIWWPSPIKWWPASLHNTAWEINEERREKRRT